MHAKKLAQLQRQERILQSLKRLDYLTTSQLLKLHGLKSERNARKTMQDLAEYVHVMRDGENIYYLNAKGRATVDCKKIRKSTGNVRHFIMRNGIYIKYGSPTDWKSEMRITSKGATKKDTVTNVADALFKRNNAWHIVEVDNTQNMAKNTVKISKYRELVARGTFGNVQPVFIWVTTTASRRAKLLKACEGLQVVVYVYGDLL